VKAVALLEDHNYKPNVIVNVLMQISWNLLLCTSQQTNTNLLTVSCSDFALENCDMIEMQFPLYYPGHMMSHTPVFMNMFPSACHIFRYFAYGWTPKISLIVLCLTYCHLLSNSCASDSFLISNHFVADKYNYLFLLVKAIGNLLHGENYILRHFIIHTLHQIF
jgi:hypothetical protein